jgi:hypothetical protein
MLDENRRYTMLIPKPIQPGNIVSIKMSNGDELIAKLGEMTDSQVKVSKPMLIMLAQDPSTGQPGVQMAPFWMIGADPEQPFPVSRSHIQCMVLANQHAAANYTKSTTSLEIPTARTGMLG